MVSLCLWRIILSSSVTPVSLPLPAQEGLLTKFWIGYSPYSCIWSAWRKSRNWWSSDPRPSEHHFFLQRPPLSPPTLSQYWGTYTHLWCSQLPIWHKSCNCNWTCLCHDPSWSWYWCFLWNRHRRAPLYHQASRECSCCRIQSWTKCYYQRGSEEEQHDGSKWWWWVDSDFGCVEVFGILVQSDADEM